MMKGKHTYYYKIFIISIIACILIPSVHAEDKIVTITDSGHNPQSYYYKGEKEGIYVIYSRLDRLEDNPNGDIDTFIRFYDFETDTVSDEVLVGRGHGDSHGVATLCIDDHGYIHVFYGCHIDELEYAVSTYPENITSWSKRTDLLPDDYGYTYPKAIFANGSIYVFFRSRGHGGASLNQGKYALIKSDDYGKSWSKQIEFVDASNNEYAISVYPTSAKYANGYFHVTWYLMLESGPNSNYYGPGSNETQYNAYYAKSSDGIIWYNVDKSHASVHITMCEMDKFYQVFNSTNQTKIIGHYKKDHYGPGLDFIRYRTIYAPSMEVSSSGTPYIGLKTTDDGNILRYWNNSKWWTIQLPSNTSFIPFFVSKELSQMQVNALSFRSGSIFLTDYGYQNGENELRILGRHSYKLNDENQTFDYIYHYTGPSLIFKEGVRHSVNSKIDNHIDNQIFDNQILKIINNILEPYPILKTWFLRNFLNFDILTNAFRNL